MCFFSKRKPELKRAKKNIVCYKILFKDMKSPYFDYQYEYDKIVMSDLGEVKKLYGGGYVINRGLHSYSKTCIIDDYTYIYFFEITDSKHNLITHYEKDLCGVFEAIIPANSLYYRNEDGEYVSTELKITKRLI